MTRADLILGTMDDLVTSFLWDDRKEDEDLPRGQIEEALDAGEVTIDEITARFRDALTEGTRTPWT
jgi:hypothetical protein